MSRNKDIHLTNFIVCGSEHEITRQRVKELYTTWDINFVLFFRVYKLMTIQVTRTLGMCNNWTCGYCIINSHSVLISSQRVYCTMGIFRIGTSGWFNVYHPFQKGKWIVKQAEFSHQYHTLEKSIQDEKFKKKHPFPPLYLNLVVALTAQTPRN